MKRYFGRSRSEALDYFTRVWLKEGPPVCFLQGFSGVGKTDLAHQLIEQALASGLCKHALIEEIVDRPIPSVAESFQELAAQMSLHGVSDMHLPSNPSGSANLALSFEKLLQVPIVLVLDQVQRFFRPNSTSPIPQFEAVLSHLRNRPGLPGRLLLLCDGFVERARWSEWIPRKILKELQRDEAIEMLDARLDESELEVSFSLERKHDVLRVLSYNPRAIEALVAALHFSTLDEIIKNNPGPWAVAEREVDRAFLRVLERDLLEHTLAQMDSIQQKRLRHLAVYRRSFKPMALELICANRSEAVELRSALQSRFFLNLYGGSLFLNPIVREIAKSRLRGDSAEFKRAHSAAADYYMRPFRSQQIVSEHSQLAASFAELRFHLVQAGRREELLRVSQTFTDHLRREISSEGHVPENRDELDERIGVLTVLLGDSGAKPLELHLARCLRARSAPGDREQAIIHAARATGQGRYQSAWVLLAELTHEGHSADGAMRVIKRGISASTDKTLTAPLYYAGAEILLKEERAADALPFLDEGMASVPAERNVFSLYEIASRCLCKAGRVQQAISLLRQGVDRIPRTYGRRHLELCIVLLQAACGRGSEIGELLGLRDEAALSPSVQGLGKVLLCEIGDEWNRAAKTSRALRNDFPVDIHFATHEALSLAALGDYNHACQALKSFPDFRPERHSVATWLLALIQFRRNEVKEAYTLMEAFVGTQLRDRVHNDELLLRIWDEQVVPVIGSRICFNLPILPPEVSGTRDSVFRVQYSKPCLGHLSRDHKKAPVFISYAWGDETPDGIERQKLVELLCDTLRQKGWTVGRDRDVLNPGDSIDELGKIISGGSRIIAVISRKYLYSESCMVLELFRAFQRCAYDRDEFRQKIIALLVRDAVPFFKSQDGLFRLVKDWDEQVSRERETLLERDPQRMNTGLWERLQLKKEMAERLAGMLEILRDAVMPRGFEAITENGFAEVIQRLPRPADSDFGTVSG
jgi:tetratricopeptide (TPR) repeat protein